MRKKILSAFIALTMAAACMTACSEEGTERDGRVTETTTTTAATTTTEQTTTAPVTTEQTTTTMQESKIDVGFQTYTYKYKDNQNYEYEVTLTLSPWILESKADVLDAAWAKVGKGHSKPSKDNMNLQKYSNNRCMTTSNNSPYHLSKTFDATVTEMYFSVGTVTVKNVTNGWSFSEQEPGSTDFSFYWIKNIEKTLVYSQDHFITRNIYSDSEEFNVGEIFVRPKMKKDKWGPMTIVLGHAENFSPKYPNGEYRKEVENGYLQAGSDTIIKIPIYGESKSSSTKTQKNSSEPKKVSGNPKTVKGLMNIVSGVYKKDMQTAMNIVAGKFGIDTSNIISFDGRAEETPSYLQCFDASKKVKILGIQMGNVEVGSFKKDLKKCGGVSFSMSKSSDDNRSITRTKAKQTYDMLYKKLTAELGKPTSVIDKKKEPTPDYYWVEWKNTKAGDIWLCWGADLWSTKGYNNCFLSFSHSKRYDT